MTGPVDPGSPHGLVEAYAATLGPHQRAAGAVYTPRALAEALVGPALGPLMVPDHWDHRDHRDRPDHRDLRPDHRDGPVDRTGRLSGGTSAVLTVCDPCVGGGTFLLAAADALVRWGIAPPVVVGSCLWGADVDPEAVRTARAALARWLADNATGSETASGVRLRSGESRAGGAAAGDPDRALARLDAHLVVADTLSVEPDVVWPDRPAAGFDAVIGNPPFQDQLSRATARSRTAAAALRDRLGDVVTAYVDTAALFLAAALDQVRPGGRIVLILPQSVLGARHAGPARAAALARARLDGLWWSSGSGFGAATVDVGAPMFTVASPEVDPGWAPTVARWWGDRVRPVGAVAVDRPAGRTGAASDRASWSFLVRDLLGVPASGLSGQRALYAAAAAGPGLNPETGRPTARSGTGAVVAAAANGSASTLGALGRATAGFRHQYYGVVPFVANEDHPAGSPAPGAEPPGAVARLVTSGLIDPGRCDWGRRPCRFAGRRWTRPVVDLAALAAADPSLARWADSVMVPKVVLATQTRVLEAAVDRDGRWWPSVPVVAVVPHDAEVVHRVAAVLLAPPVSAWAFERTAGTARSRSALKLSARDVAEIPLPVDGGAWAAAAELLGAIDADDPERVDELVDEAAVAMTRAYGRDDEVLVWWRRCRPRRPAVGG